MRVWIVPERRDAPVSLERRLCDAALNTATTAVHDSNTNESGSRRLRDVFVHHRRDVLGPEAVEIELRTYRQYHRPVVVDRIGQEALARSVTRGFYAFDA